MNTLRNRYCRPIWMLAALMGFAATTAGAEPSLRIVFTKLKTPVGKFSGRITFSVQHPFAEGDLKLPAATGDLPLNVTRFEVGGQPRPHAVGDLTVAGKKWKVLSITGDASKPTVDVEAEYVFPDLSAGFEESYVLELDRSRVDLAVTATNGSGFDWADAATTIILQDNTGDAPRLVYEGKVGNNVANNATSLPKKVELAVAVEPNVAFTELKAGAATTNARIVRLSSRVGSGVRAVVPANTKITVRGTKPDLLSEVQLAAALTLSGPCSDCLGPCNHGTDEAFVTVGTDQKLTVTPALESLAAWLPLGKFDANFLYLQAQAVKLSVANQEAAHRTIRPFTTTAKKAVFAPAILAPESKNTKFENVWLFDCNVQGQTPENLKPALVSLRANLSKVLELERADKQQLLPLLTKIARSDSRVRAKLESKAFQGDVLAYFEDVRNQLDQLIKPASVSAEAKRKTNKLRASYAALRQLELNAMPRPGENRPYLRPVAFECREDKLRSALAAAVIEEREADARFTAAVLQDQLCAADDCPPLWSTSEQKTMPFISLSFKAKRGWEITPPPGWNARDEGSQCDSFAGAAMPASKLQAAFIGPEGATLSWSVGPNNKFHNDPLVMPGRQNFPQPGIYQLKLTDLPGRPGVELYPTLEIAPVAPRTAALLTHSSIPVEFTENDLEHVLLGRFVTKVVYVADPGISAPGGRSIQVLLNTQFDRGEDPIAEADRRGTIVAIIRIGNKDLESPAAN
ncbi:MAG: hypothetical protein C0483_07960 [Pirellula sp.]|nr:hypothetical protein [Pirellula sp.]